MYQIQFKDIKKYKIDFMEDVKETKRKTVDKHFIRDSLNLNLSPRKIREGITESDFF